MPGVAPGRLDLMGGVADYSGSLVLQVATLCATTVLASLEASADEAAHLSTERFEPVTLPLAPLRAALAGSPAPPCCTSAALRGVRLSLTSAGAPSWAGYVFGSLAALAFETGWLPPSGHALRVRVSSRVPLAQGVSSSASIEVATLRALDALRCEGVGASATPLTPLRTAHMAQAVENFVVGAPCGLMDQLASALGAPGRVLPILCRPDVVDAPVALPPGVVVVGWPSGVQHAVSASPYLQARTAAFMAKKALEALRGGALAHLTELSPSDLLALHHRLPTTITGADFTAAHGAVDDELSNVRPEVVYDLQAAARFPVEESFRCSLALTLLRSVETAPPSPARSRTLSQVGELMRQTHRGYGTIGLGCGEVDIMLDALSRAPLGVEGGVYGARMSGGGSGGTVAILAEESALPAIEALAQRLTFGTPFPGLIR